MVNVQLTKRLLKELLNILSYHLLHDCQSRMRINFDSMKLYYQLTLIVVISCQQNPKALKQADGHSCTPINSRFSTEIDEGFQQDPNQSTLNMVLIPGGNFNMGADDERAWRDEYPKHNVQVDSFWMDIHEVTNAQFVSFIEATNYVTTAEKSVEWDEIKKELPPGTPRPMDSQLAPASLVFVASENKLPLDNVSLWWRWQQGANWRQPEGPGSNIIGKENHPVVHVSWFDAVEYCNWAGKRLPTEAEWEYASRGGLQNKAYSWGDENLSDGKPRANTWEGNFPYQNNQRDGYYLSAPVRNYASNGYGLYDMSGNVWEWCADWYHENYYKTLTNKTAINPKGPETSYDSNEPYTNKRVTRGGSFLCHKSYCSGYRNSMRMKTTPDTGSIHTGFRAVKDL